MKKLNAAMLIIVLLLVSLSFAGCGSDTSKPESVAVQFFKALNDKDVNAMVSCVVPEKEKEIRASGDMASGKLEGVKISDALNAFPTVYNLLGTGWDEVDYKVKITVGSEKMYGDKAVVNGEITLSTPGSEGKTNYKTLALQFDLQNVEEKWRIVDIK